MVNNIAGIGEVLPGAATPAVHQIEDVVACFLVVFVVAVAAVPKKALR